MMDKRSREAKSLRAHFFNDSLFHASGELNWRQLIGRTLGFMGFFLLVYVVALYFVKDHYHMIGLWVVEHLGLMGVAIFSFLTDMFIVPMSVDILFPFVMEEPAVPLLATMSIASAVGGIGGYWIGRLLGHLKIIKLFTSRFSSDGERLINRYGVWAVVLAGLTPIPFSTVCWIAGMLRVNPYLVALAALSRFPRMVIYYLVIRGGLSFIF
jgi:membrane protein YqaA with SNARE-associated domain